MFLSSRLINGKFQVKTSSKSTFIFSILTLTALFATTLHASTESGVTLGTLISFHLPKNRTEGWIFSVDRDVTVTHLGIFNFNSSGPGLNFSHQVAIWNENNSSPLAAATVPAGTGASQRWPFRYVPLGTPVVLEGGNTYIIGAFYPPENTDWVNTHPSSIRPGSYINYLGYSKATGGFVKPNQPDSRYDNFGPNFLMIPPEPIPIALEITGPSEVAEGSSVQYTAKARYDNGSTTNVTVSANWSLEAGTNASINATGLLQTEGVTTPEDIIIYATYTEGEVSLQSQTTVQVYSLSGLEVIGLDEVREGCSAQYKAVAFYDNNNTTDVTNSANWWVEPTTFANISSSGLLQAKAVETPEDITVHTEYTEGNVALEAGAAVQVILYSTYTTYVPADYGNIQAAIDASCDGDTIIVADGTYTGDGNRDISFKGKAITLKSENGPENCIIDCNGSKSEPHRGFYFYNKEDPNSILDGFTIANGFGPYKKIYGSNYSRGGAIHCYNNGSPTIKNCIIRDNQARNGGAIECYAACSPIIQNCIFMDNLAQDGDAGYGGTIYCELSSRPKISNCLFLRNRAGARHGYGGAIYSSNGGPTAINCDFVSNKAEWGGAIASIRGASKYTNCIFWDNYSAKGKDIGNGSDGTIAVEHCHLERGLNWPSIFNRGTIIDGGGNTSGNPGFVDSANDNFGFLYNSPCVDAGTNEVTDNLPATDLSGEERFVDGNGDGIPTVDIGAYEFQEPNEPYILLSSHEFEFIYLDTDHDFEPQVLSIRKVGIQDLYWEINEDCSWLDITPTQGNIATGEVNDVTLTVDTAGLSNGNYSCELTVVGANAGNSPQAVQIFLYVRPIQEAIDTAKDGDTVVITPGIYRGKYNRDLDFGGKAITLRSTDPNDPNIVAATIIDCNGTEADPHRAFYFHSGEDGNSVVAGFTIKNGYADNGAGVYCIDSSPVITNCNFINGSAGNWGGGINCYKSSPLISNCTFTGNSAREGGAITTRSNWGYLCSPLIQNCHIFNNTASGSGGGINSDCLSTPIISNCLITENFAGTYGGGGISIFQSNPTIINCLITHNFSDNSGGGILHWYGFENGSTITNCTIASNSADEAGGIFCSSEMMITNSILWDNSPQQIIDQGTVSVIYSNVQGDWPGPGNIDTDPCFVDPGYWADANDPNIIVEPNDPNAIWIGGDYHLYPFSLCINVGDPNYLPEPNETDLDGRPRILFGRIDMGAYEFNHLPVADAGPNQVAYAWIDGIADVNLDGSASYDPDGNDLTYLWTWTIEPNTYDANGVTPTIELPVGEHTIELIVNDGADDSEPNYVTITVVEPVESRLWIFPRVINRQSRQRRIMAWLRLPQGIIRDQIDSSSLLLYPGQIEPTRQFIFQRRRRRRKHTSIIAFFDKADLMAAVPNGPVELWAVGQLKTGRYFYGSDTIRIISHRPRWRWRKP